MEKFNVQNICIREGQREVFIDFVVLIRDKLQREMRGKHRDKKEATRELRLCNLL